MWYVYNIHPKHATNLFTKIPTPVPRKYGVQMEDPGGQEQGKAKSQYLICWHAWISWFGFHWSEQQLNFPCLSSHNLIQK